MVVDSPVSVKDRLRSSTERELLHFADRYREEHTPGHRSCKEQEEVIGAAEIKGYPVTLIRFLGAQKRGEGLDEPAVERIAAYRDKLGLGVSQANRVRG